MFLTAMEVALSDELHPKLFPTVEVPTPLESRKEGAQAPKGECFER